ncbi:MAG: prepilin-type N-terminal cleavage/methylation domain-containing protein [Hyphomicrobiaceae bacterium]|nr:prepilin-type N-terminal cleavage/methylation domain-containing protein [Hyphomicrobiaceae bacterium]
MRARQDGFTLVELLAVLVVLAIVAGLAATNLGGRHSADVLQATAHELASRCRAARSAAIWQASDQIVVIDMGNRVITAGKDVPPLKVADTVSLSSETSATEQRAPRVAGIRFFPNGGSTGGKIRLETGRQAYEVRVNWLTGRVAVQRVL